MVHQPVAPSSAAARSHDHSILAGAQALDTALAELSGQKAVWAHLPPEILPPLLDEVRHDLTAVAEEWVAACCTAKGLAPGSFGAGEEWVNVSLMMRLVRLLRDAVAEIARERRPRLLAPLRTRPDGRVVAPILTAGLLEAVLYPQMRAEVWMQSGQDAEAVRAAQAWAYRQPQGAGRAASCSGPGTSARSSLAMCCTSCSSSAAWCC